MWFALHQVAAAVSAARMSQSSQFAILEHVPFMSSAKIKKLDIFRVEPSIGRRQVQDLQQEFAIVDSISNPHRLRLAPAFVVLRTNVPSGRNGSEH